MGLIDLQTDLKSLKYSTVPGNGTGPIIRTPIPETQTSTIGYSIQNPFKGPGFFDAIGTDVERIGGWFNENRGSWAIKQATLEAFNPRTELPLAARIPDILGVNALANTAGSPLGIHLHKNGIAGFISDRDKYESNVRENNFDSKNRLVELTNRFIYKNESQQFSFLGNLSGLANNVSEFFNPDDPILFSYVGGPGGPITTIRKASNQKGTNEFSTAFDFKQPITKESLQSSFNPFVPKNNFLSPYILPNLGRENNPQSLSIIPVYSGSNPNANFDDTIQTDPYELGLDNVENTDTGDVTYLEKRDFSLNRIGAPSRQDVLGKIMGIKTSDSNTPRTRAAYNDKTSNPNLDFINAHSKGKGYSEDYGVRDLIKFRFGIINNNSPSDITSLQFRAYLTNISDNFNPSWDSVKYIGRGEEFYNYTGFSRNISFNLAFAATTREELIPLYKKINYLASLTAPDYTDTGYIRGNIVKITIGDYIDNQPGVIDSLSYNIEDNVPWEINLEGWNDVGQFPHVLKATIGMKLIHNFLPKKGSTSYFIGVDGKYDPFTIKEKSTEMQLRDVKPIDLTLPQQDIINNRPLPKRPTPSIPVDNFDTNVPLGSEGAPSINIPGVF